MKHVSTTKINDNSYNGSIDAFFFGQRWFVNAPYAAYASMQSHQLLHSPVILYRRQIYILVYTYLPNRICINT